MITNPLGFAGRSHQTARTRHGWSKALQLAPDLYPGVGGKRFRAALLQRAYEFAGGRGDAPASIIDAVEMESDYNRDLLPNGILGLNSNYINQYVRYLADRRLEELGFEAEYKVTNPAKWMATANDTLQLVNFFESTNTSYESNASAAVSK
jgi:hypothetical protein